MKRCFAAILDPNPSKSEVSELWDYFDNSCAYCGAKLDRHSRSGHLDHAMASAEGGSNSIYNYVLSCAICNGDEKRGEAWHVFLTKKVVDPDLALTRKYRIEDWISRHGITARNPQIRAEAELLMDQALRAFDEAVEQLRKLRCGA